MFKNLWHGTPNVISSNCSRLCFSMWKYNKSLIRTKDDKETFREILAYIHQHNMAQVINLTSKIHQKKCKNVCNHIDDPQYNNVKLYFNSFLAVGRGLVRLSFSQNWCKFAKVPILAFFPQNVTVIVFVITSPTIGMPPLQKCQTLIWNQKAGGVHRQAESRGNLEKCYHCGEYSYADILSFIVLFNFNWLLILLCFLVLQVSSELVQGRVA